MVPVFLVCFGVCVVYMGQVPEIKLMYVCMYVGQKTRATLHFTEYLDLFNKHARYVRYYTVLRFQGDVAIHQYFGQETLVTVVDNCTFLVLTKS